MTDSEDTRVTAMTWETPFANCDADRLHLLRVDHPSCHFVSYADGRSIDFSNFAGPQVTEIWLYSEEDETVYRVRAEAEILLVHDERDSPRIDDFTQCATRRTMRLTGTMLHRSVTGFMTGDAPSFYIFTGNDCVEFLARNEPVIEAITQLHFNAPQDRH